MWKILYAFNPFQPQTEKKPFAECGFNLRSNIRSESTSSLTWLLRNAGKLKKNCLEKEEQELKASEAYKEEFERNRVDKVRKSKEDVRVLVPQFYPEVSKRDCSPQSKLGAAGEFER